MVNNKCLKKCRSNEFRKPGSKHCQCKSEYLVNGKFIQCRRNELYKKENDNQNVQIDKKQ